MKVRRAFLLGAGASKSWGLPLTNELFPLALKAVAAHDDRKLIRDFIQYQYPYFHGSWENYPRFEEFLSLVDVYLEFANVIKHGHKFKIGDVARLKRQLLLAIPSVLHSFQNETQRSEVTKFAALLAPGDAVVTFNWDLLIEHALHDLRRKWKYSLRSRAISLLKPHGSLDWFDGEKITVHRDYFPLNKEFNRILVFKRFHAPPTDNPDVPVILPPVVNKKLDYQELESIWRDSWLALRYASELYILGYSLPPEDLHARLTIRSAIRANENLSSRKPRIVIVNPDRNVYLRFARLVTGELEYFESGLQGVSPEDLVRR